MLVGGMAVVFPAKAYAGTNVYIDPPLVEKQTGSTPVGSEFTVSIKIGNFTNLVGYEYKIAWNRTVLTCTHVVDTIPLGSGPFIATNITDNNFNATHGMMWFVVTGMHGGQNVAAATLRQITFKIMSAPPAGQGNSVYSLIDIYDELFGDALANPIDHSTFDGEFRYSNPNIKDTTPPVTTDNYDGLWHTTDVTVTLTATDDVSGVADTFYKINGGSTQKVSTDGQPKITLEGANNTVEYWSVDNANNAEAHHALTGIKLDKTAPTGSIVINSGDATTTSRSVTLTLTSSDALSGVDKVRYSNDGVWDTEPWEASSPTKAWQLTPGNGNKTVYYEVADKAGLTSITYSDTILLNATTFETSAMALAFNGVDNYVSVPAVDAWTYSFELWFNPTANSVLIGSSRFAIKTADNKLTVWYDVNAAPVEWTAAISLGDWHHLVVAIDYRVWRITAYLDSSKLGEQYGSTMTKPALTWVKIGTDGAKAFFNGKIDELRVYGKILDASTVKTHYSGGNGTYGRPESGLIGGWHFDDGIGDNARDYSRNNRNGTVYGATWVDGHVRLPEPDKGDVSGDRVVNILDLILVSNAFNSKPGDPNWNRFADANGDGRITIIDIIIVARNIGRHL